MNIDPAGGRGIGPDVSGTDYPFVAPSADIRGLLADCYLAHARPAVPPLRIVWLAGMDAAYNDGVAAPADSGTGAPHTLTHTADVVIVDAADTLVFDSTAATGFRHRAFSGRLHVYEWSTGTAVCRLVQHTAVPTAAHFTPRPAQIYPADGRLAARCTEQLPARVTSLNGMIGDAVVSGGFNATLAAEAANGLRRTTRVTIDLTPGGGLGRAPGCNASYRQVASLGGVMPDAHGNVTLTADGCYWVRRPLVELNGLRTVAATIQMGNDCAPCDDCDDYARAARAIVALFERGVATAAAASAAGCALQKAIDRWNAEKACREARAIRMNALAFGTTIEVVAQICNTADTCLDDVTLRIVFDGDTRTVSYIARSATTTDGDGRVATATPAIVMAPSDDPDQPSTTAGTLSFHWRRIAAMAAVTARFRFRVGLTGVIPEDGVPVALIATATAGLLAIPTPVHRTPKVGGTP